MRRLLMAFRAFWLVLKGQEFPDKHTETPKISESPAADSTEGARVNSFDEGAMYTLVLLQREGRLIDFLQENIESYTDEQVGTAVRQIHKRCKRVLDEYYKIVPVLDRTEGEEVVFEKKFDTSSIMLSGNIPPSPPYCGILRHKGWKVDNPHFPSRSESINSKVIHSAEVEIK